MEELNRIVEVYKKRDNSFQVITEGKNFYYDYFTRVERELRYLTILRRHFEKIKQLKLLEIGAGTGDNILFFQRFGIPWENLYANELMEERGIVLHERLKTNNIFIGDALNLNYSNYFDVVFQSTVFTSILDYEFKRQLAQKMKKMVKEDGIIIWYDFKYDNPKNENVKGIRRRELKELFGDTCIYNFYSTTFAPPLGRRLKKFYNFFNVLFPFMRTHIVAVIQLKK
jgi:SAM-dependent methyltransferase